MQDETQTMKNTSERASLEDAGSKVEEREDEDRRGGASALEKQAKATNSECTEPAFSFQTP